MSSQDRRSGTVTLMQRGTISTEQNIEDFPQTRYPVEAQPWAIVTATKQISEGPERCSLLRIAKGMTTEYSIFGATLSYRYDTRELVMIFKRS